MDDGADLVTRAASTRASQAGEIIGATEETTTGVIRLRAMEKDGVLKFSGRGGQRRQDQAFLRQSLRHRSDPPWTASFAPPTFSFRVSAWWWPGTDGAVAAWPCGPRDGCRVIVTEMDPMKAMEAMMDGFDVMPMAKRLLWAIFSSP